MWQHGLQLSVLYIARFRDPADIVGMPHTEQNMYCIHWTTTLGKESMRANRVVATDSSAIQLFGTVLV